MDRSGNIYIADTRHDRIIKLDPSGRFLAKWGKPGDSLGQLNQPASIAVDAQGNVYVADFFNDRVQKFSPAGNPLWATSGRKPLRS